MPAGGGTRFQSQHLPWDRDLLPWQLPPVPAGVGAQLGAVNSCQHPVCQQLDPGCSWACAGAAHVGRVQLRLRCVSAATRRVHCTALHMALHCTLPQHAAICSTALHRASASCCQHSPLHCTAHCRLPTAQPCLLHSPACCTALAALQASDFPLHSPACTAHCRLPAAGSCLHITPAPCALPTAAGVPCPR